MEAVTISEREAAEAIAREQAEAIARDEAETTARDEAEEFLVSFDALAQAVRRARGTTHQDSDGALTLSQYAILQALTGREHARVSDLATEAGIAPSTATRILDALERRAIVTRRRSAEDRRGVTIRLTDRGRDALNAQDAWMRGRQRAFFDGLPARERELAPDLLVRLAALIDDLAAGPRADRAANRAGSSHKRATPSA